MTKPNNDGNAVQLCDALKMLSIDQRNYQNYPDILLIRYGIDV